MNWRFQEHWWGETAKFRGAGYDVHVQDCDGDFSWWCIKRDGKVVAGQNEEEIGYADGHHWETALRNAENALKEIVALELERRKGPVCGDSPGPQLTSIATVSGCRSF